MQPRFGPRLYSRHLQKRMSGLRGFLDAISTGSFMGDASERSHDNRLDAEIYTELSTDVNNFASDEDEDSSGEDNEWEINHPPEIEYIVVDWELLSCENRMENENLQESSPDCLSNDEGSTSQQASVESDNNEDVGELPHGENQMENEYIQESLPPISPR
ncbi:uncharacterized protein LOC134768780 [Penaeus indicus]|uniref:uncharacterized protein LOC134768780 n=1 Tax=Penaeus indicus TaxID=29960 RepID=UPI00300D1081